MSGRVCLGTETWGPCDVSLDGAHGLRKRCERCAPEAARVQHVRVVRRKSGLSPDQVAAPVSRRGPQAKREAPLANLIERELIRDPLATGKEVGERLGVSPVSVANTLRRTRDTTLKKLQREVFEKHYRRVTSDD